MLFDDISWRSEELSFSITSNDTQQSNESIVFDRFSQLEDDSSSNDLSVISISGDGGLKDIEKQPVNQLMLISLLEHICSLYSNDEEQSSLLFKVLCEKLTSIKLIPTIDYLDEFKALRTKYQVALSELMQSSLQLVKNGGVSSLRPEKSWQLTLGGIKSKSIAASFSSYPSYLSHSWYKDMFEGETTVGHGGFGKVIKAMNKLDKKVYAIKKIKLVETQPSKCLKILREVRVFSNLYHENIVRYHAAWLEYDVVDIKQKHNDMNTPQDKSEGDEERLENESISKQYKIHHGQFGRGCSSISSPQKLIYRSISSGNEPLSKRHIDEIKYCYQNKQNGGCKPQATTLQMTLFIQMELCQMTLRHWLQNRNKTTQDVDWFININILQQLFKGLQYIHGRDLLHRDIKPENIFMNVAPNEKEYTIKIGDFGLARNDVQPKSPTVTTATFEMVSCNVREDMMMGDSNHTMGVGTATYAAPEQKYSKDYTNKIDVYSAGIITFEMFQAFSTQMERVSLIQQMLNGQLDSDFVQSWNEEATLILQMTHINPLKRPCVEEIVNGDLFSKHKQVHEKCRIQLRNKDVEIERLKKMLSEMKICEECQKHCSHSNS